MRTWLDSINNGTTIYIVYALILLVPSILLPIIATGKVNLAKFAMNQVFAFYLCCLFALVFLPLPSMEVAANLQYKFQAIPFHFIVDIMKEKSLRSVLQVVFNIVMTVPFGMYLRYAGKLTKKQILVASFLLTCFIELGQLTGLFFLYDGSYRLCDVDDLMTNTLGGFLGCLAYDRFFTWLPDLNKYERVLEKGHHAIALMH